MADRDPRHTYTYTEEYDQSSPIEALFVDEFLTNYKHFKGMLRIPYYPVCMCSFFKVSH